MKHFSESRRKTTDLGRALVPKARFLDFFHLTLFQTKLQIKHHFLNPSNYFNNESGHKNVGQQKRRTVKHENFAKKTLKFSVEKI